jgi:WD40 repeat protein
VSADGARVATACHDGRARVWDATKPVFLKRWRGHGGAAVRCVSFSDHAENVVSGGRDRGARVWDPHAHPGSRFFFPRRRD